VVPTPAAAVPAGAHGGGSARWQVLLGTKFRDYEDAATQRTIEEAWANDDSAVEVLVRGTAYVIRLGARMVQEVKGAPDRWRQVRRLVKTD